MTLTSTPRLVSNKTLAVVAEEMQLNAALRLGVNTSLNAKGSADTLEAI